MIRCDQIVGIVEHAHLRNMVNVRVVCCALSAG